MTKLDELSVLTEEQTALIDAARGLIGSSLGEKDPKKIKEFVETKFEEAFDDNKSGKKNWAKSIDVLKNWAKNVEAFKDQLEELATVKGLRGNEKDKFVR